MKRRLTRVVRVGNVPIGGNNPVAIQSMTKVKTADVKKTVAQIRGLESVGCEIIRVAVKDGADAAAIRDIRKKIRIPLVADIHFDHRLALAAIAGGADKIRINPGNMKDREGLIQVIGAAKRKKIPIRIGLNSGSLQGTFVSTARKTVRLFEHYGFRDLVISLKSSDVQETVAAYRALAPVCDYPFHLGVTAAGSYDMGIVKSSIGIGGLLLDGIGDTVRVSLTGDPLAEVFAAKRILEAVDCRSFGPRVIACPTCGRCQVDLVKIVHDIERHLLTANRSTLTAQHPFTIAIMGCEVNGPGEAKAADIGIAFGKNAGMIFKNGKIIGKVSRRDAVRAILKYIK
ncbi:MAG: flavodoxin-dependent (E)-4-hydroxy-3-methylbut-2-enyl-diphosphate synthase [Candidatus Omnitrophica bacterium]|nr:flavodoxin-dependent (E)-4-hydroxy-3-methylbut-2-enyl-diphosphate synthase [Candidatus Omnitrophota bacterium]